MTAYELRPSTGQFQGAFRHHFFAIARKGEGAYPARSRPRLVAAMTALVNSGSSPFWPIRTSSAAAVVPPGDVTLARKVAASSSERCSNSPEPAIVARASFAASAAGKPATVPARASNSANRNTYAGPDPDTAVTAS